MMCEKKKNTAVGAALNIMPPNPLTKMVSVVQPTARHTTEPTKTTLQQSPGIWLSALNHG